jgi:hypothetical protein
MTAEDYLWADMGAQIATEVVAMGIAMLAPVFRHMPAALLQMK